MKNKEIATCLQVMQQTFEQSLKRTIAKHLLTVMKELQESQEEYSCLRDKLINDNCIMENGNFCNVKEGVDEKEFRKELFEYENEIFRFKTSKMEISDDVFEYCSAVQLMFLEEFFTFVSPNKDTKQDS